MNGTVTTSENGDYPSSWTDRDCGSMDSYYDGMVVRLKSRLSWVFFIVGIIAMGILSRVVHTGLAVFDKYLGDALYAMMVYGILRLLTRAAASAVCAVFVMTAIELFQLTMIPANMLSSEHLVTQICARLIGVQFGFLDLLAYGVGIGFIYLVDSSQQKSASGLGFGV
ncbi:MAG: DUF2809 domain-containing protein [Bryobacteraceae bacterium]|nr:DUF2809 domain-containing protein [Bryobacteraceae bacterium]